MHAWFDISAGVAGDMLLGALLDAGADPGAVQTAIDSVAPGSVRLETEPVTRGGQRATKARVRVLVEDPPHRTWSSIRTVLEGSDLAERTRSWAMAAFGALADAEGRVHGVDPDLVHFHEVGALDSIADVVGTCEALRQLGVTSVSASPVRLGSGRIRAAHGDIPVPVPAVTELSIGWEVQPTPAIESAAGHPHHHDHPHDHDHGHGHGDGQADHDAPAVPTTPGTVGELATPTGMALVRALAAACQPLPGMTVSAVGVGAGGKDFPGWPNVVRVVLGESAEEGRSGAGHDRPATELTEIRANVDDLDPRLWPGALDAVLGAGAADAWLVPIQMKKGRPAFTLHALAHASAHDAVVDAVLAHTTTLGVRESPVNRTVLDRTWVEVDVLGRSILIKVASRGGVVLHATPEFASVADAARTLGLTEADVALRAQAAAVASGLVPGSPLPGRD